MSTDNFASPSPATETALAALLQALAAPEPPFEVSVLDDNGALLARVEAEAAGLPLAFDAEVEMEGAAPVQLGQPALDRASVEALARRGLLGPEAALPEARAAVFRIELALLAGQGERLAGMVRAAAGA